MPLRRELPLVWELKDGAGDLVNENQEARVKHSKDRARRYNID